MIGPVSYLDAVFVVVPLILGLVVMKFGIARSLLSFPVRLIMALILSWAASAFVVIYLLGQPVLDWAAGQLGAPRTIVLAGVQWTGFLIVLVVVWMILSRLRVHTVTGVPEHSGGAVTHLIGFVFGAVSGFLLTLVCVVPPFMFYEAFSSNSNDWPTALAGARSLPLIKRTSDATRQLLQGLVPPALAPGR